MTEQVQQNAEIGTSGFTPMAHADDAELAEIEAALKAAETGKPAEVAKPAAEVATPEAQPVAEGAKPAEAVPADAGKPNGEGERQDGKKGPPMVPHWRVRELVEQAALKARAETLEEALHARPGATRAAPDQPTAQEQIATLDREIDQAATAFDEGKISLAQFKQVERANDRKIAELSRPAQTAAEPTAREDLYLAQQTDKLAEEFPVLNSLTAADVEPLVPLAYREAARQGVKITPDSLGDYNIRRFVGVVASRMYGEARPAPATSQQQQQPPAGQQGAEKIERLAKLPPDLNQLSAGAPKGADPMDPQRFMSMDVDEIAALPETLTRKISGR